MFSDAGRLTSRFLETARFSFACASESKLAMKPENVSFEEAASAPLATFTALQGLRKGLIKPGEKVLINGAAGGVGTFAVQIAKSFGAEVTGVCSTRSVDLVRSIGADYVIDYTQQDFTETGRRYDLVYDLVWRHSWSASRRILNPHGRYVMAGGAANATVVAFVAREVLAIALSSFSNRTFMMFMAKSDKEDLAIIRDLMADGKVKPVIDKRFTLSQVPDAVRYAEEGHARGKVVISVE
jgi:NADPH:quinone reductase-like Zn-dependent oxidoreductase